MPAVLLTVPLTPQATALIVAALQAAVPFVVFETVATSCVFSKFCIVKLKHTVFVAVAAEASSAELFDMLNSIHFTSIC